MDSIMALGAGLISSETQRIEAAGRNVANIATPGYKREIAFADELAAQATGHGAAAQPVASRTDFSTGKLVHTGNPLDMAITGPGFFEVATPDGMAYTRRGSFARDASGRLVTTQGWALQGSGGDIVVSAANWHIERDGTVIDNGNPVAVISVVAPENLSSLKRLQGDTFVLQGTQPALATGEYIIHGYLESSNSSIASDMMQVMDAMRRVESAQKVVHAWDDMMGAALQRMGEM